MSDAFISSVDDESTDTLANTVQFFHLAFPPEDLKSKNLQTQLGVHFEEVAEMISTLYGVDLKTQELLRNAYDSLEALANYLKGCERIMAQVLSDERTEFLDSLADQIVTAAGCAYTHNMDIVGALREVNRSNNSKFDDMGRPIYHPETRKLMKGPNYSEPKLAEFTQSR